MHAALTELRENSGLIGVGGLVMVDGKIMAQAADGLRKKGHGALLTTADKWHMRSLTKPMTATLIGTLVEDGLLGWDWTLLEMLPDMPMDDSWHAVTLHQLLTHTAGLPANFPLAVQLNRP